MIGASAKSQRVPELLDRLSVRTQPGYLWKRQQEYPRGQIQRTAADATTDISAVVLPIIVNHGTLF